MFYVIVNKYPQETSNATREMDRRETLEAAIKVAKAVWNRGLQRFVYVVDESGKQVFNPAEETSETAPEPETVETTSNVP